jgi:hypothetical protein
MTPGLPCHPPQSMPRYISLVVVNARNGPLEAGPPGPDEGGSGGIGQSDDVRKGRLAAGNQHEGVAQGEADTSPCGSLSVFQSSGPRASPGSPGR